MRACGWGVFESVYTSDTDDRLLIVSHVVKLNECIDCHR